MPNNPVWVVTWLPPQIHVIRRKPMAHRRKRRKFDDLKSALGFVMHLNKRVRATAEIKLPGSVVVGFSLIEQMHTAQKSAGK
jgi:hypothetical protein